MTHADYAKIDFMLYFYKERGEIVNILNIRLESRISTNGFKTSVTKDGETSEETLWSYGYNCSYSRCFADNRKPYVADVLQKLIDENQISSVNVTAGQNVFAGKQVSEKDVEVFKSKYCSGLKFHEEEMGFADAVASIPEEITSMEQ